MCTTCGCSTSTARGHDHGGHFQDPVHAHALPPWYHAHSHDHGTRKIIDVELDVLAANDTFAEDNRDWFAARRILALNMMSSPGSGKTSLLERTVRDLTTELTISVIGGDQATPNDAKRIAATGCRVIQINTGPGCHLDAAMISRALATLDPPVDSLLVIENVGNLVCPALFDLGEQRKVVLLSVTEGEDKPLKYPHMFHAADLVLLTKTDLLPYLDFDVGTCIDCVRQANAASEILPLSSKTGEGLDSWHQWLRAQTSWHKMTADV